MTEEAIILKLKKNIKTGKNPMAEDVIINPAKSFKFIRVVRNEVLHSTIIRDQTKLGNPIPGITDNEVTPVGIANKASKNSLKTQSRMTPQDRLIDIVI